MTHRLKRCDHCQRTYYYQGSGRGCHEKLNDSRYCPECMELVLEALKKRDVLFMRRYKDKYISDEDIENIIFLEEKYREFLAKDEFCLASMMHSAIYINDKIITYGFYPIERTSRMVKQLKNSALLEDIFYKRMITINLLINKEKNTIRVPWEWNIKEEKFEERSW